MHAITRVFETNDLALKAAHQLMASGISSSNITLSTIAKRSPEHLRPPGGETEDAGIGPIVAGPEARIAGMPEEDKSADDEQMHEQETLLSVQTDDITATRVRAILDQEFCSKSL